MTLDERWETSMEGKKLQCNIDSITLPYLIRSRQTRRRGWLRMDAAWIRQLLCLDLENA
jgi:hypothetical protein